MTTYTAIPNGDVDQDSPVTQTLMTLLRDNPIAIAEGATGAPVQSSAWHPYNKVTVGDSNDGLFYDHAVDGTVADFETPVFEPGYEYMVLFDGILHSRSTGSVITCAARRKDLGTYAAAVNVTGGIDDTVPTTKGAMRIRFPSIARNVHMASWEVPLSRSDNASEVSIGATLIADTTAREIDRLRFGLAFGANYTGGRAFLIRRREYITG